MLHNCGFLKKSEVLTHSFEKPQEYLKGVANAFDFVAHMVFVHS
jgi:hypothetical protein